MDTVGQTEPFILLAVVILQKPTFNCEVCTVLGLFLKTWTTLATNRTLFWFESLRCLDDQILVQKFAMLNPYAQPPIQGNLLVLETRKFVNKRYICVCILQSASDLQKKAFLISGCGTWIPGYFAAQKCVLVLPSMVSPYKGKGTLISRCSAHKLWIVIFFVY